jgi:hypothetical protein
MSVLERLITTVLTYLNAAGYYKSAEEIQNAINVTQLDLYKRLRGNMAQYVPGRPLAAVNIGQTAVSTDALWELYLIIGNDIPSSIFNINEQGAFFGKTIDLVLSLEVEYPSAPGQLYPVNIVPDNQYLMLKNNPVVPPIPTRPLGRIVDDFSIEVLPAPASKWRARVLTLPTPVAFTFVDNGSPLPTIVVTQNTDWTADKLDNLVYGTVANLGFNLSNGVLVQSGNSMNEKIL